MLKLKMRKTQKGDKTMENYEVKGVSQATEIRKAYEEAVKANAPKYRAVSKSNLIYGWDEKANKFIKAEIGQEWFDNPHYVEPIEEKVEEEAEEPIVEEMVEVANEMIEEVKAQETVEEKTNFEEMYKKSQNDVAYLQEKVESLEKVIEEKDNKIDDLQEELDDIKESAQVFKRLFE